MKTTWNGIKSLISLITSESRSPETIANNKSEVLTNPIDIVSSFNKLFVAPNIQSTIKQNFKLFRHYLTNPCIYQFLISPCTKKEILVIISNFDNNKATGINSIPLKSLTNY